MMVIVAPPPLRYSHTIGLLALTGRGFSNPMNAAVSDAGLLYVVNRSNSLQALQGAVRITVCSVAGDYLNEFGAYGTQDGQFVWPTGIDVDSRGNIYLADGRNDRLQKFSPDGTFVAMFGRSGSGTGELSRPADVAVDVDGNVYVADWGNERVTVFEPDGYPLTTLIGDADLSKWGGEYIAANDDIIHGRQIAADMTPEKRFWGPTGVVIDNAGHVMIVDSCRHRVQVYDRVQYEDV